MILYKAQIELHSPISTTLKGDTIWGHLVWGIANHEGAAAVDSLLDACKSGEPPLVISSAFPEDLLPKPIVVEHTEYTLLTKNQYAEIKEKKKRIYIQSFLEEPADVNRQSQGIFTKQIQMHNTINRTDLTVSDGGLFATEALWANPQSFQKRRPIFDVYIASSYPPDQIIQYLKWAFENGYGADASSGKGVITVHPDLKVIDIHVGPGMRCMALGPFVSDNDLLPQDLLADLFIRRGKVGGAFAPNCNPYKKTIVFFNEGATFTSTSESLIVGKVLQNIHTDDRICQSGFCPVIPLPVGGDI